MSTRKRLTDKEGQFLAGDQVTPQQNIQDDAMRQILSPPLEEKEATTRFTADLPVSLHDRLSQAALKTRKTKVQLVREILETVLPK